MDCRNAEDAMVANSANSLQMKQENLRRIAVYLARDHPCRG